MLDKLELEDKIVQMLNEVQTFLDWSKELSEIYDRYEHATTSAMEKQFFINSPIAQYVNLHTTLYYFESISTLNSLLNKGQRDEISLKNYIYKYRSKDVQKEIEAFLTRYKTSTTYGVRNKIGDHKASANIGSPSGRFILKLDRKLIDEALEYTKEMSSIVQKYFDDPIGNNPIKAYFDKSHHYMIELFDTLFTAQIKK